MADKLLSVIIPAYNMERFLERCVNSLVVSREMFDLLDIIVVNDGSKDNTSAIAHRLADAYSPVVRVIDKTNGNYGSCVNRGIEEAVGQYVRVLDSDDYFEPDAFARYLAFVKNLCESSGSLPDLVITDHDKRSYDGEVLFTQCYQLPTEGIFGVDKLLPIASSIGMLAMTFRLDLLMAMKYQQTEGVSYTDNELVILPMKYISDIAYCRECVYHYYVGREGQSISQTATRRSVNMFVTVFTNLAAKLRVMNIPGRNVNPENQRFIDIYLEHLIGYVNNNIVCGSAYRDLYACFKVWNGVVQQFYTLTSKSCSWPVLTARQTVDCPMLFWIAMTGFRSYTWMRRAVKKVLCR